MGIRLPLSACLWYRHCKVCIVYVYVNRVQEAGRVPMYDEDIYNYNGLAMNLLSEQVRINMQEKGSSIGVILSPQHHSYHITTVIRNLLGVATVCSVCVHCTCMFSRTVPSQATPTSMTAIPPVYYVTSTAGELRQLGTPSLPLLLLLDTACIPDFPPRE